MNPSDPFDDVARAASEELALEESVRRCATVAGRAAREAVGELVKVDDPGAWAPGVPVCVTISQQAFVIAWNTVAAQEMEKQRRARS